MKTRREKVLKYVLENPNATVQEITTGLYFSSTSVTQHHLVKLRVDGELPEKIPLKIQRALKYKKLLLESTAEAIEELNQIIK